LNSWKVTLQALVTFIEGEIPEPIYDITNRIDLSSELKKFTERIERGYFAFCANTYTINKINNSDSYFEQFLGNDSAMGFQIAIYHDDVERFRGDVLFDDIKVDSDTDPKTVSITIRNLMDRLGVNSNYPIAFRSPTIDSFLSMVEVSVNDILIAPQLERNFNYVESDVSTALSQLSFENLRQIATIDKFGDPYYIDSHAIEYNVKLGEMVDSNSMYLDPLTGWLYHFKIDNGITFYKVRSLDKLEKIVAIDNEHLRHPLTGVRLFGEDGTETQDWGLMFCPSLDKNVLCLAMHRFGMIHAIILTINKNTGAFILGAVDASGWKYYNAININTLADNHSEFITDGHRIYKLSVVVGGGYNNYIKIDAGGVTRYVFAKDINSVYAPYDGLIVWFGSWEGQWQFMHWIDGVVHWGNFVLGSGYDLTERTDYFGSYIQYPYGVIPFGYSSDNLNGKYAIFLYSTDCKFRYMNSIGYIPIGGLYTNNPIYAILAAVYYECEIEPRVLLDDFCQLFNCIWYVENNTVVIKGRDSGLNNYTISESYLASNTYSREFIDMSKDPVKLSIKGSGLTNNSDHDYDLQTVLGSANFYYRYIYSHRRRSRKCKLPEEVGKNIRLGYNVTISETGEAGRVMQKEDDYDDSKGNMTTLVLEKAVE